MSMSTSTPPTTHPPKSTDPEPTTTTKSNNNNNTNNQTQTPLGSSTPPPHTLPITTHHCRFCNHLLLATTRALGALPHRKKSARDSALILPLRTHKLNDEAVRVPSPEAGFPSSSSSSSASGPASGNEEGKVKIKGSDGLGDPGKNVLEEGGTSELDVGEEVQHYTILLSTTVRDRKAVVIAREDGFEKRFFLRCGRCKLVMGYFLDEGQFLLNKRGSAEERGEGPRVVYLLPGALAETEIMSDEEKMRALDREWSSWFRG